MQYEEMLTWLLFYTSLLDLEKMPAQEVADPGGLVQSQVVESTDGALRFVLNASQSQRTQSSRFLIGAVRLGRAAHRLRDRRHRWRPSTRLERTACGCCRFPRTTTTISRPRPTCRPSRSTALRAHNILYDREGDAEYLQVYTETFDQRFFFEIVERRGYRGYGAANAPIRLAAQARLSSPGVP